MEAGFTPGGNPQYSQGEQLGDGIFYDGHTSGDIAMRNALDIIVEAGTPNRDGGEAENFPRRVHEQHVGLLGVLKGVRHLDQIGEL